MACKNEQCRCRSWCEIESDKVNDMKTCEEAVLIAHWWKAKVAGLRDPDEDFTEEDFEDG